MAYGLIPDNQDLTPTDEEHLREYVPCPIGQSYQGVGDQDGWIPVKFSRFIEAWHALGRMYVDTSIANASEEFFKPLLNQPQDRTWDIVDPYAFCPLGPPAVPGYADLDTSAKVFEAVKTLVMRRLWFDKCSCHDEQVGGCRSMGVINWAWEDDDGGSDSGTFAHPASGQLGGWGFKIIPANFDQKLLVLYNVGCGAVLQPGNWLVAAETSQRPSAKFTVTEVSELALPTNGQNCLPCPPRDNPPPPSFPPTITDGPMAINFDNGSGPCFQLNLEIPPGDDVVLHESLIPITKFIDGKAESIGVPVRIAGDTTGPQDLLYQLLFKEIQEIKEHLVAPSRAIGAGGGLSNLFLLEPFALGGPPEVVTMPDPLPIRVVIRVLNAYPRNSEVRYFCPPDAPPGQRAGQYGWFAWQVPGGGPGERQEIWIDRQVLDVPPGLPNGSALLVWAKPGLVLRGQKTEAVLGPVESILP